MTANTPQAHQSLPTDDRTQGVLTGDGRASLRLIFLDVMRSIIARIIAEHYGDDLMERECAACEGMGYAGEGVPQEPCVACGGSGYAGSGRDLAEVCADAILAALSGPSDDDAALTPPRGPLQTPDAEAGP